MRCIIAVFIFILVNVKPSFSQSSVWMAQGNGTKLYIGGTIHKLRETDYPLPDEYYQAYNNSAILVTESDGSKLADSSNFQRFQGFALYWDGTTLKGRLSREMYHKLDSVCQIFDLELERMKYNKPLLVLMTISNQASKKKGATADGVESHFIAKAVKDQKSFLFLESFEEHLNLIAKAGLDNENEFFQYALNNNVEVNDDFDVMVNAVKSGKSEFIVSQLEILQEHFPEFYKLLVKDRNDNWIPQIEEYFSTPSTEFILVGAMHLYGPDGIIQQLKDKGFIVKQL